MSFFYIPNRKPLKAISGKLSYNYLCVRATPEQDYNISFGFLVHKIVQCALLSLPITAEVISKRDIRAIRCS